MSANTSNEKHGEKLHVSKTARSALTGTYAKKGNTKVTTGKNIFKNSSKRAIKTRDGQKVAEINLGVRAASVAQALGSKSQLATLLKVTASQPTRWINGEETPNGENARALVDLDHVVARARLLWKDEGVVKSWLTGHNAFLGGARPIDVITLEGTGPVIDALDQEMAGGYA